MSLGEYQLGQIIPPDRIITDVFTVTVGTRIRLGAAAGVAPGGGQLVGVPISSMEIFNDSGTGEAFFVGGYQEIQLNRRLVDGATISFDVNDVREIVIENQSTNANSIVARITCVTVQGANIDEGVATVLNFGSENITAIAAAAAAAAGIPTTA